MSFLINWVTDLLVYLGVWRRPKKVLLLGLDNSGKTTLVYYILKEGQTTAKGPHTHYSGIEDFDVGGVTLRVLDLGGMLRNRYRLFVDYFPGTDAVVYVIDAADRERFVEAKKDLNEMLSDDGLAGRPVLVLGNKTDKPGAISEEELITVFGLQGQTTGKTSGSKEEDGKRPLEVFMCSVLKRTGFGEGFRWLVEQL